MLTLKSVGETSAVSVSMMPDATDSCKNVQVSPEISWQDNQAPSLEVH